MTDDQEHEMPDCDVGFSSDTINRPLRRRELLIGLGAGAVGATGGAVLQTEDVSDQTQYRRQVAGISGGEQLSTDPHRYRLPSVGHSGDGQIISVEIERADGSGNIFVDLSDSEPNHDAQLAIREALQTASSYTGVDHHDLDLFVSFDSTGDVIRLRGKSWEAGLVVSFAAVLTGTEVAKDTLTTGVVGDDGSMIPVGSVEAKAEVARQHGANRLFVPASQVMEVPGIPIKPATSVYSVIEAVTGIRKETAVTRR